MVLLGYLPADFEDDEKPKGVTLKVENFFVEGVNERCWRRVRNLLKSSNFLINKK